MPSASRNDSQNSQAMGARATMRDQQQARHRQAAQHPLLVALLRPKLGGIASGLPRQADRSRTGSATDGHRRQASSARHDDGVARRQAERYRRTRRRQGALGAAGGMAHRDRLAVGQRHIEQRAFALVDELLHLAGKDVEAGAVRLIHNLQLLRAQHQKLRGRAMPRRLRKLRCADRRDRRAPSLT